MAQKIIVAVPAFGQTITASTFLTICGLQQQLAAKGIGGGVTTLSFPDIAELRNMFLTIWYDSIPDATHLLFVDADMGFSPDLVMDMLLFDEPLVGAIYPQRKLPLSWAGSGTGEKLAERRGDFMRVEGVGMGCTLIRRDMITKMLETTPEISDPRLNMHPAEKTLRDAGCKRIIRAFDKIDSPERGIISEDLSFCIRWNKMGGQTWAAIGHRMSHVGMFDYAARYLDSVQPQIEQASPAVSVEAANIPNAVADVPSPEVLPCPVVAIPAEIQVAAE